MKSQVAWWRDVELGVDFLSATEFQHRFSTHAHPELVLAVFCGGAERFRAAGRSWVVGAGDVLVLPPGLAHDGEACAPSGYTYRAWYVAPSLVSRLLLDDEPATFLRTPVVRTHAELASQLTTLHRRMERQDGGPLEREELMYQVLSLTASHLIAKPPMPSGRDQRAALRAQAFVHEHYASDIRAAGLATAVGVSESSVAHAFKQAFQCSPGVYQTALRLSEARRLIGAGMPIAEVAVAVGFADQSHFSRRFKAAFGVTPGKCRQVCSTCADQASSGSAIFSV